MTAPKNISRRRVKTTKPFHWFQGASVRELYNQLSAAGPDTARLEVHTEGKSMTFLVVPTGIIPQSHNQTHINESHLCPPDCPGGG